MNKTLTYIDNNFYRITPADAKAISFDGKLPRHGHQKAVYLAKLKSFGGTHGKDVLPLYTSHLRTAWLQHTPIDGKQTLALKVFYAPY